MVAVMVVELGYCSVVETAASKDIEMVEPKDIVMDDLMVLQEVDLKESLSVEMWAYSMVALSVWISVVELVNWKVVVRDTSWAEATAALRDVLLVELMAPK